VSALSVLREVAARLAGQRRPSAPPPAFGERLAAAIARDPQLLLRVVAFERSLAAPARDAQRADLRNL